MKPPKCQQPADAGSATVEFLAVGVLLLVPLIYLILCLGRVQAATFAAESGAREAARILATTPDADLARARAEGAVELALDDQGFAAGPGVLGIDCAATPCRSPQARIATTVHIDVPLPLVPAFLGAAVPTTVGVQVRRVAIADRFATR